MNPWLWFWSQTGVLIVQLLRLSSVNMLSLGNGPIPGHKLPLISHQYNQNGRLFFHYTPWTVKRRTLHYGKALNLHSLPNVRNVFFNKDVGLSSAKASNLYRKRKRDKSLTSTWLPAAQVRSGLHYALHPNILHTVIPFHSKSGDLDVREEAKTDNEEQTTHRKTSRATKSSMKEVDRSEIVPSFADFSQQQISSQTTKIMSSPQKESPTHKDDDYSMSGPFGGIGFDNFDSLASIPMTNKDEQFGGFFGLDEPQFVDKSDETLPSDDMWINAGSGQIADGFGDVQVFEGEFVDESKDCDVIDTKSCGGDKDCLCYGLYECSSSRCVPLSVSPSQTDIGSSLGGFWHEGPVDIAKRRRTSKTNRN